MAVNHYFQNYTNKAEQRLVEDLIVESIKICGAECYYLPMKNKGARDLIYGEDPLKTFPNAFMVELYPKDVTSYTGDREFFSKFGLEIRNSMTVVLSKRTYHQRVKDDYQKARPMEGDLIYIPVLNGFGELYEIRFVNQTMDMAMLGRKTPFSYELELEKFKYSHEEISTGVPRIDVIQTLEAYSESFTVANTNGQFQYGEVLFQSSDNTWANAICYGTLIDINTPTATLNINGIVGVFTVGQIAYGNTSCSNCIIVSTSTDNLQQTQDHADYDNSLINTEANNYVNLSEINPFGSI